MTLLTLFTAPKAFTDPHIALIQRNALLSWLHLGADARVVVIGNEPGLAEAASELGVTHLVDVACTPGGTPLISSIFALAHQNSDSPLLAYINADVILLPDFLSAARRLVEIPGHFLVFGRRWDLDVRAELDFAPGWDGALRQQVQLAGRLHPPMGSDYFIFRRDGYAEIPDFAVGRAGWDNWMIYHACQQNWLTVDGTPSVMIVHQQHDYRHLPGQKTYNTHPESDENRRLAGSRLNTRYTLADAKYQLEKGGIRAAHWSLSRLLRRLELWLSAHNDPPRRSFTALYNRVYAWRTRLQTQR